MSSTKTNTWISVDKKEPPFGEMLLFSNGNGEWTDGTTKEIVIDEIGKSITVKYYVGEDLEEKKSYIFWMKPEPPTK